MDVKHPGKIGVWRLAYLLQTSFPGETSAMLMRSNNEQLIIVNWREQVDLVLILWLSATPSVADSHTEIGRNRLEPEC